MKPTLGYPSRAAAVEALRKKGMTTEHIAETIGISPKNVIDVEYNAERKRIVSEREQRSGTAGVRAMIPMDVRMKLSPKAVERDVSIDRLISDIVIAVAYDDLVDAVLDDKGGAA